MGGRADDGSKGIEDVTISFMRSGCWYLEPRFNIRGQHAIRYVRGRFQGWGYFDLERCVGRQLNEILLPGNAILSTLHHPVAGSMSNVFIAGTFKGKLNDWDGDGNAMLRVIWRDQSVGRFVHRLVAIDADRSKLLVAFVPADPALLSWKVTKAGKAAITEKPGRR